MGGGVRLLFFKTFIRRSLNWKGGPWPVTSGWDYILYNRNPWIMSSIQWRISSGKWAMTEKGVGVFCWKNWWTFVLLEWIETEEGLRLGGWLRRRENGDEQIKQRNQPRDKSGEEWFLKGLRTKFKGQKGMSDSQRN